MGSILETSDSNIILINNTANYNKNNGINIFDSDNQ